MDLPRKLHTRFWAACLASLLGSGCLGGSLDAPTYRAGDDPPIDTIVGPGPGPEPLRELYPALTPGQSWEYDLRGGVWDEGSRYSLEVLGDSVLNAVPVYVESSSLTVPDYGISENVTVRNYSQRGRIFARKSDQEVVREELAIAWEYWYAGDSVGQPYRLEQITETTYTGDLPDSLEAGAAWTLTGRRHRTEATYANGEPWDSADTTFTVTRSYAVRSREEIAVAAGTFDAFELRWSNAGSQDSSRGWFAPAAKAIVRQIDYYPGGPDTTDLVSFEPD